MEFLSPCSPSVQSEQHLEANFQFKKGFYWHIHCSAVAKSLRGWRRETGSTGQTGLADIDVLRGRVSLVVDDNGPPGLCLGMASTSNLSVYFTILGLYFTL